jgi:outer membrane lipoprotein SlyB
MAATSAGVPLKWLWAAIAALGLCVLALGATLVAQQRPGAVADRQALASPAPRTPESEIIDEKRPAALSQRAQAAPEYGANQAPAAVPVQRAAARTYSQAPQPARYDEGSAPQPVRQEGARAPVCAVCGRIEAVQAVQQAAPATGVGAVAGGVLGAVVGNQVGKGSGRTAATVLGAVGGGYVGHTVEQRTRTQTVYEVRVRMDDGSVRRFTRSQPVPEGAPVRLEGKGFQLI